MLSVAELLQVQHTSIGSPEEIRRQREPGTPYDRFSGDSRRPRESVSSVTEMPEPTPTHRVRSSVVLKCVLELSISALLYFILQSSRQRAEMDEPYDGTAISIMPPSRPPSVRILFGSPCYPAVESLQSHSIRQGQVVASQRIHGDNQCVNLLVYDGVFQYVALLFWTYCVDKYPWQDEERIEVRDFILEL